MNGKVISGITIKSAISKLISSISLNTKVSAITIAQFNNLHSMILDDISYPSVIYDIVLQGMEIVKNTGEPTNLQRDLYHNCLVSIHYQLSLYSQ